VGTVGTGVWAQWAHWDHFLQGTPLVIFSTAWRERRTTCRRCSPTRRRSRCPHSKCLAQGYFYSTHGIETPAIQAGAGAAPRGGLWSAAPAKSQGVPRKSAPIAPQLPPRVRGYCGKVRPLGPEPSDQTGVGHRVCCIPRAVRERTANIAGTTEGSLDQPPATRAGVACRCTLILRKSRLKPIDTFRTCGAPQVRCR
jgi:hypothetical protein